MADLKHKLNHQVFGIISAAAKECGLKVYVIGGYVRDLLLGKDCKDFDFVVQGSGIEFAKFLSRKLKCEHSLAVYKNFGTAMLRYKGVELEFVGARKESYDRNSRKPVVENGTLEDDQKRRDFTINALAISLNPEDYGTLTDPFNGLEDLEKGIIKTPLDAGITFSDDPLRMLRAVRFACRLGFKIEENTFNAISRNTPRIEIVSKERITDELNKIMLTDKPSRGFAMLDKSGLLEKILPQLSRLKGVELKEGKGHKDNFLHTLQVLDNVAERSGDLWLRYSALFHDIAKPNVKKFVGGTWTFHNHEFIGAKMIPQIFKALKLPLNEHLKYVQKLVGMHHRAIPISNDEITDSAVRRLMYDAGEDLDDLLLLCEADITSKIEEKKLKYLNNYQTVRRKIKELEQKDFVRTWQPPVDGNLIMETFDLKPSRTVGEIKDTIKDSILDGKIENSFEAAYALMLELGAQLGLEPVKKQ